MKGGQRKAMLAAVGMAVALAAASTVVAADSPPASAAAGAKATPVAATAPKGKTAQKQSGTAKLPHVTGFISAGDRLLFDGIMEFDNPDGRLAVAYDGAPLDTSTHPFFAPGPNGRACVTCHQPKDAMSLSAATARERWAATNGQDPLFDLSDGANCPNLPKADPKSHSLLLERGLFRIALPWPPKTLGGATVEPEFTIEVVSDPTGCNTSSDFGLKSATPTISVFRRPRPAANMRYFEAHFGGGYNTKTAAPFEMDPFTGKHSSMRIMSDARVTSLVAQALDASRAHMGFVADHANTAAPHLLSRSDADEIVEFQRKVYAAQISSNVAGRFDVAGTPKALGVRPLVEGRFKNGNDRNTGVFFFFDEWKKSPAAAGKSAEFRESVARGNDIFFFKPIWIRDTNGLNDFPQLPNPYKQTCAFCHNTQLLGNDDVPGWMDIGASNMPHAEGTRELPTFKITCKATAKAHPYLGREIYTHDPGRALISGRCNEVGSLIMQQFRGLSARAPYFSNGSAENIRAIIDFYDRRYNVGFTDQERQDLVNFLSVL